MIKIDAMVAALDSDNPRVKYGSAKALRGISEKAPARLYGRFDFFAGLLDHENRILRWDATRILANLAAVDSKRKFERIFARYFAPVRGPEMISAANVIAAAPAVAAAKPHLTARIVREILKVEKAKYKTAECRNVAVGHAIKSLDRLPDSKPAIAFVRRQLRNSRPATRKKAERFLRRRGGQ